MTADLPSPLAIRARFIFPGDASPLPDGVLTLQGQRIVAVGENLSGQPALDLGNVAILPGLVNAHTHLEFSDLSEPLGQPGMRFPDWIFQVVTRHRRLLAEQPDLTQHRAAAIARGLAESRTHGTTMLGEIAAASWPKNDDTRAEPPDVSVTVFRELLGLADSRVPSLLETARSHLAPSVGPDRSLAVGLSPHAPYTVHLSLLSEVCRLSAETGCPVAMHLAESPDELELLQAASGRFLEVLRSLEAWDPTAIPRGIRPRDYLEILSAAHRALVIHGNYLARDEIEFLAVHRDRMSVVYCPRTHAYFAHGDYPLAEMLAAGVCVALGTDSRASNPDLSVLTELRHAYFAHPTVPAAEILRLATANGVHALGRADEAGTLAAGKLADLTVVQLPDADADDPHVLLFETPLPVVARWYRGQASRPA